MTTHQDILEFEQYQSDFYNIYYHSNGCTCFLGGAPCSYCTHPGHPTSIQEYFSMNEVEVIEMSDEVYKYAVGWFFGVNYNRLIDVCYQNFGESDTRWTYSLNHFKFANQQDVNWFLLHI